MNVTQLLEKSKTISLLLPPEADAADTQTALLLACGLKKLGKLVSLEHAQAALGASLPKEKTFVVSLKGLAPWIATVRYEKDTRDLRLYFTLNPTAGGEISPEALSLHMQSQTDLTIIVGDTAPQNNALSPEGVSVLPASQMKNPLLELLRSQEDLPTRLLGAALSNIEYVARLNTQVIVLHQEDFRGMPAGPKHLPLLVPVLRESFGDQSSYVFFFDSLRGAQGVLWSSSPQVRTKFRDIAGGQQKDFWVLLRPAPLSSEQLKYAFLS